MQTRLIYNNCVFLCIRLYWSKIGTIVLAGWVDPLLIEYAHQHQDTNILQFNYQHILIEYAHQHQDTNILQFNYQLL